MPRRSLLARLGGAKRAFQRDVDKPLLDQYFPGWPVKAYFEFAPIGDGDGTQAVEDVSRLAAVGVDVDPAAAAEKTGLEVTA